MKLEFFEPPAVPGFGAAGGFSMRVLDKTNTIDYKRLGEVTDKFMAALAKRKEVKGLFTFFASNYPQYELVINNDVAMQKGVSIADAMDNLSIVVGSTWEQGFIRFGQFYKVFVQADAGVPAVSRGSGEHVRQERQGGDGPLLLVHDAQEAAGPERDQPLQPVSLRRHPGGAGRRATAAARPSRRSRRSPRETLPRGYGLGWEGLSYDEANKGNLAIYIFLIVVIFVYLVLVGQYESFILPLAVILSLPVGLFGSFLFLQVDGAGQRRLRPDRPGHAGRPARQERDPDRRIRGATAPGGR